VVPPERVTAALAAAERERQAIRHMLGIGVDTNILATLDKLLRQHAMLRQKQGMKTKRKVR
jgi:hypothetical protein